MSNAITASIRRARRNLFVAKNKKKANNDKPKRNRVKETVSKVKEVSTTVVDGVNAVKEYADEGISGKNIENRTQFKKMLNDIEKVYYSEETLHNIVAELGRKISEDYKEKDMLNFVSMICAIYTKYYI